jgi:hypothetical protein
VAQVVQPDTGHTGACTQLVAPHRGDQP